MAAQKSFNTRIDYGDQTTYGASSNWTSFANVVQIKPPNTKVNKISTTTLTSPNETEEAVPGLIDPGSSTFKIKWNATQTATIYSLLAQPKGFRVVYPDFVYPSGSILGFSGWIASIENEEIQADNTIEATIEVQVTGSPVFIPASGQ